MTDRTLWRVGVGLALLDIVALAVSAACGWWFLALLDGIAFAVMLPRLMIGPQLPAAPEDCSRGHDHPGCPHAR